MDVFERHVEAVRTAAFTAGFLAGCRADDSVRQIAEQLLTGAGLPTPGPGLDTPRPQSAAHLHRDWPQGPRDLSGSAEHCEQRQPIVSHAPTHARASADSPMREEAAAQELPRGVSQEAADTGLRESEPNNIDAEREQPATRPATPPLGRCDAEHMDILGPPAPVQ
jgi:hypothetical protein